MRESFSFKLNSPMPFFLVSLFLASVLGQVSGLRVFGVAPNIVLVVLEQKYAAMHLLHRLVTTLEVTVFLKQVVQTVTEANWTIFQNGLAQRVPSDPSIFSSMNSKPMGPIFGFF